MYNFFSILKGGSLQNSMKCFRWNVTGCTNSSNGIFLSLKYFWWTKTPNSKNGHFTSRGLWPKTCVIFWPKCVCPSVGLSVCPSVPLSVCPSVRPSDFWASGSDPWPSGSGPDPPKRGFLPNLSPPGVLGQEGPVIPFWKQDNEVNKTLEAEFWLLAQGQRNQCRKAGLAGSQPKFWNFNIFNIFLKRNIP